MDKMNSEEVDITINNSKKQESGGGNRGFADFMDNMKSKFTGSSKIEQSEVRNSRNGGEINFTEYRENINTKYENNNVQVGNNEVRQIETTEIGNAGRRIGGEGGTITNNIIIEKETGASKGGKYNFGAFMDSLDNEEEKEEEPEVIFNKTDGGNGKISGKISVVDNNSSD